MSTNLSSTEPTLVDLPHDGIPLIPMRNLVLFPQMVIPITVGRETSLAALQYALKRESHIGLVLQKDPDLEQPGYSDLYSVGTVAKIARYVHVSNKEHYVVCQGVERFRLLMPVRGLPFIAAHIEKLHEPTTFSPHTEALRLKIRERATELFVLMPEVSEELTKLIQTIQSPTLLADFVSTFLDVDITEKQKLLEAVDIDAALEKILDQLTRRIEILKLSQEIDQKTRATLEGKQREFLLREQLKTIQDQLGDSDTASDEIKQLAEAIQKAKMPPDVEKQAQKELKRLERLSDSSGMEYSINRSYLEWLTELPWSLPEHQDIDLKKAKEILEADHFGLERIKQRILEFLAVQKLNPEGRSPILCFVGPPGVGKTSLGQSIARATGREFTRISLGGVHDEAEIRGHRRTYIGALPGNIIQGIRKAEQRNCVMMLDEVDKVSSRFHGDPSAALLEVLDPEQNSSFRDNYLAVPFDLSRVMFIATANVLDDIPGPLRDRMEVIDLPGYTYNEKMQIAKRYLIDRQLKANGLKTEQCTLSEEALQTIIHSYTREAGVRQLEREIGHCMRYVAMKIADETLQETTLLPSDLQEILGPSKFESEMALRTSLPGVATGLAWTPTGGDILFIEAASTAGTGKLILTGQLGDVMKESAQAALTLVKSKTAQLGIASSIFAEVDIHIHVPAGAIPKDGPSAGVAMFIALASLFTGQPIHHKVAMTGEISLRGLVLPVGGIKEKVLAALRAGISTIMLPKRNQKDLIEIPIETQKQLHFIWLENVEDAIEVGIKPIPG
ncbi:MAG: endopeptidase La [Pseudomonadota bacterium]